MDPRVYFMRHPSTPPPGGWRWQSFQFGELECKDGTGLLLDVRAVDMLQSLRDTIRKPIIVNSAYRSISYNAAIGGAPNSMHLSGRAFDIHSPGFSHLELASIASQIGFTGIGIYGTFVHVDTGPVRTWRG